MICWCEVTDLPLIVEKFILWHILPNTDSLPIRVVLRLRWVGFVLLLYHNSGGGGLLYVPG